MRFQCPFCQGIVAVPNTDLGIDCQCGHCAEIVTVPSYRLSTGAVIADFIILEELGRGGMGIVYLAHQMTLDRPAALKILSDAYAGDTEFVVDFIKEARAAAKLNHPHIVQAYAVGEDEGVFFFAMEHIDGETMKTYMKREGVVEIDFALEVVQQIAEALDYAWKEQRLIHRDIKPDNIMLTKNGRAKLADLGLARVAGEIDDADSDEVMGTPQYISPEHLTGAEMDVRSDIYSLGATLFHLITGRFAFEGRTATEIARKHLEEPLTSPKLINPLVSDGVCDIIFKMMAKNADERYQNAEDLVEDLRLVRKGKKTASSGKSGKQFSVKKGGGKTLMMKAPSATGVHQAVMSSSTGKLSTSSTSSTSLKLNTESLKIQREKKAKTQLIVLICICTLALLGGVGFIIWHNIKKKAEAVTPKTPPAETPKIVNVSPDKPKSEPTSTAYTQEVKSILAFAKASPKRQVDIMVKCDKFLLANPSPTYNCDKNALTELLEVYVPIDEDLRISKARADARKKHLAILKANEDSAANKQAEIERKKRAEERKKREEEMKADRIQKQKERLEAYIKSQDESKEQMRYRSLYYSIAKKYKQAIAVFDSAIKEPQRVPELQKPKAEEFAKWGKKMQDGFKIAEKVWEDMSNAGAKLNGLQIEATRGQLGKVTKISNGNITVKTFTNQNITVPLEELSLKQLKKLLDKTSELLNEKNGTFFFMLSAGEFQQAKDFCPEDWISEIEETITAYLKIRIELIKQMGDEKEQRAAKAKLKKYAKLPELKKALKELQQEKVGDDDL